MRPLTVHPAAAAWPMLDEPDLRRLAGDIAAHGLLHPVVVDGEGRVLDGRNRLAACAIAGVEPSFETFEGDAVARVLSANNERRHLSLSQRAAAVALVLADHRVSGKWKDGVVRDSGRDSVRNTWRAAMRQAGFVLDHLPRLLPDVATGDLALDNAVKQAEVERDLKAKRAGLPDDLGALVDAGELDLADAVRRDALEERYDKLVASGDLTLGEAEHLDQRDRKEHENAIGRYVVVIQGFLQGWSTAVQLHRDANRDEVLAKLDDSDRDRFVAIEEEQGWQSTQS